MKTQRIQLPSGRVTWTVLDDNFSPIQPIHQYLSYLENLARSPHTVQNYARHLKLYWDFLRDKHLDWQKIRLDQLAEFIPWLRRSAPETVSMQHQESQRTESTINVILSAVCCFYDFQYRVGNVEDLKVYGSQFAPNRKYKPFLHHISKGKPVQTRLLKVKAPKQHPQTLTKEEFQALVDACHTIRDKFLLCLLHDTGMRIGQALGLRHQDIRSWDNEIDIVPRNDNANGARAKSKAPYTVHASQELMALYAQYLTNEYPLDSESNYVFVNIQNGVLGAPIQRSSISALFERLKKATGINFHPHLLRHTHATELIRSGWDAAYVQKRLGHASVQTTINTYAHLDNDDLKQAYKQYLTSREGES